MPLFQFIGATIGASVVISLASLVWPKVTSEPRPEALNRVRDVVMRTQVGQGVAQVLGVTDETGAAPIDVRSAAVTGTTMVIDSVTKSAQHAVTTRLMESLAKQFNGLPEVDKASFRTQICEPRAE